MNQLILKNEYLNNNNIKKNLDHLEFSKAKDDINMTAKNEEDFKNLINFSFEKKKKDSININSQRKKEITNSHQSKNSNNFSSIKDFFQAKPRNNEVNNDQVTKKLEMNDNMDQIEIDDIFKMIEEENNQFPNIPDKEDIQNSKISSPKNHKKNSFDDSILNSSELDRILKEDEKEKINLNKFIRSESNNLNQLNLRNDINNISNININSNINENIQEKNEEDSKDEDFIKQFKIYRDKGELNRLFSKYNVEFKTKSNKKNQEENQKKECPICFEDNINL